MPAVIVYRLDAALEKAISEICTLRNWIYVLNNYSDCLCYSLLQLYHFRSISCILIFVSKRNNANSDIV